MLIAAVHANAVLHHVNFALHGFLLDLYVLCKYNSSGKAYLLQPGVIFRGGVKICLLKWQRNAKLKAI